MAKRIFVIDQRSRLSIVQAYALGATSVLTMPVNGPALLAELFEPSVVENKLPVLSAAESTAAAGAACFAVMFAAILRGAPIDIEAAKTVGATSPTTSLNMALPIGSRPCASTMKAHSSTACW